MNTETPIQTPTLFMRFFMWGLLLLAYLLNFFHSLTTAVLQPYLTHSFNIDTLTVTTIGSMYFYCYLIMQIPVGLLVDKFGVRLVSTTGTFLAALGTALFAAATDVWLLYVGRAFIGIGTSVIFICIIKFQNFWFKPNIIMTMTGISCFIGTLGGILAQSPLAYMAELIGWRNSLYGIAFASLLNACAIAFWVKEMPIQKNTIDEVKPSAFKGLWVVLSNIRIWPAFLLYAVFFGSYVLIAGYIGTAWLIDVYNISSVTASTYIIAAVCGAAVGCVAVGMWSDKIGSKKIPMLGAGLCYLITWAVLAFWGNDLPIRIVGIMLFCIGFFSCAYVVCWSCVQEINPKEFSGIAVAVVNMGGFIGPILLPYLFVFFQNLHAPASTEGYSTAFFGIFIVVLAALICGLFVKEPDKI